MVQLMGTVSSEIHVVSLRLGISSSFLVICSKRSLITEVFSGAALGPGVDTGARLGPGVDTGAGLGFGVAG